MGTFKVRNIRTMTADTGARRTTYSVALSSTILISCTTDTVVVGTIPQTAVRGRQLRIIMTVLTVGVSCTDRIVDICYYIRTSIMTCRRTGRRSSHICRMPVLSYCRIMTDEVGGVSTMASQTAGVGSADDVACGITGNCI